ncbi:MAG: ABC transporter permease [Deltaproteobacteria bacterium]|nr:ABC transporter permease [Deltaproteobacteria bacterium]MBW2305718.1 ABC transporter permease [Deltaproteobacteria bacterium]
MMLVKHYRMGLLVVVSLVYGFLLLPLIIVVMAAFNAGEYLTFPPQGLSFRWFASFLQSEPFIDSLKLSLELAIYTMCISTTIGFLAALFVVRYAGKWRERLRVIMISPILLPSILTGIALLLFYYAVGIGTTTIFGLLMGHVLITLPYVFLNISSVLYNFDRSLEEMARSLGAGRFKTFFRITLPIIKPGVIAGAVFAFIVSFDQFTISLLLKAPGQVTLPIQLFDYVRWDFDPTAAAVATVSIGITVGVVILVERLVGLDALYR